MTRRKTTPPAPTPPPMTVQQMNDGIKIISRRLAELREFNPTTVTEDQVSAVERTIEDSLSRVFGKDTEDYHRYSGAAYLDSGPISLTDLGGRRDTVRHLSEGKASAISTLEVAIKNLNERIEDTGNTPAPPTTAATIDREKIFIVHGHDGEVKNAVARFVTDLGLKPIILDEQPSQGRTIIEKFEHHSNVGYAIVLLTPDDYGGITGQPNRPRARQNVVLELGFFAGKLGRDKVCAIVKGADIDLPSDISGLVWTSYDGDWKLKLARELKAGGYGIDMNDAL